MNKYLKLTLIFLLFVGLAIIRFFEDEIFNDPLIDFYHSTYKFSEAPSFDLWQLIMTTSFRFLLNTIISLLIIWIAFPSKKTLKFSLLIYGLAYLILILLFSYSIENMTSEDYFTIFYIRRFLIQPLFVLVLLPAFYYQKYVAKDNS
ncbi:exosortase F system-associated membrane protein [Psychroflexus aestuariivivens]|uniref:exosortase F system-associated membrane protein n=1 Tax=Psychroflexus aestuariivivens TaxID=1795040 RepID=UPI000FDBC822|nr:exosortase F system-associated protein [Psychroflexus aestuariivivens]